jgi:hypothetical protein
VAGVNDVYEVVTPHAVAAFARLPLAARDVLRLCDGVRTLESICVCSDLTAERTRRVIDRLLQLGLIAARPPAPPRRRRLTPEGNAWAQEGQPPAAPKTPEFTPDEEQFFASPIDHLVGDDFYE